MFLTIVIIANIPIFLLIGWLIFDVEDHGHSFVPQRSFWENILHVAWSAFVAIVQMIFLPRWVVYFFDDDDDEDPFWDLARVVFFVVGCVAVVWGEMFLIGKWFGNG